MLINCQELLHSMSILSVKLFSQRDYRNDHLFTSVIKGYRLGEHQDVFR